MKERITVDQARALSLAAQPKLSATDLGVWRDQIDVLIENNATTGGYLIYLDDFYALHPTAKPFEVEILAVFGARGFYVKPSKPNEVAVIGWAPEYLPA